MDLALAAQFWLIGTLLTLTPGADWAFVIGSSLRTRSATPSILGLASGYAVVIVTVALGVGALIAAQPIALTALTIAGALYLLYLGFSALLAPAPEIQAEEPQGPAGQTSTWGQFVRGVGLSVINPKGILLLIALLPQFTSPTTGWAPTSQMLTLGAIQIAGLLITYFALALLARRLLGSRPCAGKIVMKASGAIMALIGLSILVEQVLAFF